ncbi:hypothetical protein D3C72_2386580 [compost metagenome]
MLLDQRLSQALVRVYGEAGGPALGAELALADRVPRLWLDTDHAAIFDAQTEAATHPAERANARYHAHADLLADYLKSG